MKKAFIFVVLIFAAVIYSNAQPQVNVVEVSDEKQVNIFIDDELFTAYLFTENLKKPVLWPVVTSGGNEVTRQFPLKVKAGERADHPHHIGVWFNYGDVNGLDFWNNSDAVPAEKADNYGTIYHESIGTTKSGRGQGLLVTASSWKDNEGNTLLNEVSEFIFSVNGTTRIIDRSIVLRATNDIVKVADNKEG